MKKNLNKSATVNAVRRMLPGVLTTPRIAGVNPKRVKLRTGRWPTSRHAPAGSVDHPRAI